MVELLSEKSSWGSSIGMSEILTWNLNSVWGCRLDSGGSRHIPVTNSYERGNQFDFMTGGIFFMSPTAIGFWRWPLLHVVSRFVSVCNNDVWILLPHFYFRSKPFSCVVPSSFSLYFYYFITSLFQHSLQNFIPLALPYSLLLYFLSVSAVFHSLHFRFFFSSYTSLLCLFVSTIFYFNPLFPNFHLCSFYTHWQKSPFQQHLFLLPNLWPRFCLLWTTAHFPQRTYC